MPWQPCLQTSHECAPVNVWQYVLWSCTTMFSVSGSRQAGLCLSWHVLVQGILSLRWHPCMAAVCVSLQHDASCIRPACIWLATCR